MKKILYVGAACLLMLQSEGIIGEQPAKNQQVLIFNEDSLRVQQLQDAKEVAKEAGKRILDIRDSGELISEDIVLQNGKKVRQTNADLEGGQVIIDGLSKKYPAYGVISQDQMEKDPNWYLKDSIWIINPIDGTKEFEKGESDFHIQIGLLEGNEPVIGVSYYPATDAYIWAVKGQGAWLEKDGMKQRLLATTCNDKVLVRSSSHEVLKDYFAAWNWTPSQVIGDQLSSTGRLLAVIRGEASLYISLGASPLGTEKKGGVWNYGANAVIANEAGLILKTLGGNPLNLRQPSALLMEGVVITNDPNLYQMVIGSDWQLRN